MPGTTDILAERYAQFLKRQGEEWCVSAVWACRERRRALRQFGNRGIESIGDLLSQFSDLPVRLQHAALDFIAILEIREAVPVLFAGLSKPAIRLTCADRLGWLRNAKAIRLFLEIGQRELTSDDPDPEWLEAVILGLGFSRDVRATELLVSILERCDLPGSLRGSAADKLGFCEFDRRTNVYRRCRDAALRGLSDESIHVQFWSMYVLASLGNYAHSRRSADVALKKALPRLRRFARIDSRLSPGFWWPMSAEAEDAIGCIENGIWPDPDAGERWPVSSRRGVY